MSGQDRYIPGVPCWVDTTQPDPSAAARFYAGLFGCELTEAMPPDAPGSYLIATIRGQDVAAIGTPDDGPGGVWRTYIAVDDADATANDVEAEGGTVTLAPVDAGPGGRRAVCVDP